MAVQGSTQPTRGGATEIDSNSWIKFLTDWAGSTGYPSLIVFDLSSNCLINTAERKNVRMSLINAASLIEYCVFQRHGTLWVHNHEDKDLRHKLDENSILFEHRWDLWQRGGVWSCAPYNKAWKTEKPAEHRRLSPKQHPDSETWSLFSSGVEEKKPRWSFQVL